MQRELIPNDWINYFTFCTQFPQMQCYKAVLQPIKGEKMHDRDSKMFNTLAPGDIYIYIHGVTKSQTRLSNWTITKKLIF